MSKTDYTKIMLQNQLLIMRALIVLLDEGKIKSPEIAVQMREQANLTEPLINLTP